MSGIFGAVCKKNCIEPLFYGTDYHSHLGTEYGGLAVLGKEFQRRIHNISQTQFKSKFYQDYKDMEGNKGIGVISASNVQPIFVHSKFGPFCIVTNGLIENVVELEKELLAKVLEYFGPARKKYNDLNNNLDYVESILQDGALKAREVAVNTIKEVRSAVGID